VPGSSPEAYVCQEACVCLVGYREACRKLEASWRQGRSLEWCRIARGSGQPGDFDVPVIVDFAAPARAARRRPIGIGIGIGAISVHGAAPTDHNITAHCPPPYDDDSDITTHRPPAHDEDSDALAGAALGGASVMSESAIRSRRGRLWVVFVLV
jgi:hypothetical protein